MTLDELIQKLNKIKEVYPNSSKFLVVIDDADTDWYLKLKDDGLTIDLIKLKIILKANYSDKE